MVKTLAVMAAPFEPSIQLFVWRTSKESCLGRMILGPTKDITTLGTNTDLKFETAVRDSRLILVCDAALDPVVSLYNLLVQMIKYIVRMYPGPHAILFDVPTDVRYTKADRAALMKLEKVFGQRYLNHAILCLTIVTDDPTFNHVERSEELADVAQRCANKVVKLSPDEEDDCQIDRLIKQVLDIKTKVGNFSLDHCKDLLYKLELEVLYNVVQFAKNPQLQARSENREAKRLQEDKTKEDQRKNERREEIEKYIKEIDKKRAKDHKTRTARYPGTLSPEQQSQQKADKRDQIRRIEMEDAQWKQNNEKQKRQICKEREQEDIVTRLTREDEDQTEDKIIEIWRRLYRLIQDLDSVGRSWVHVRKRIVLLARNYVDGNPMIKQPIKKDKCDEHELIRLMLGDPNQFKIEDRLGLAMTVMGVMAGIADMNVAAYFLRSADLVDDINILKALVKLDGRLTDILVDELATFLPRGQHCIDMIVKQFPKEQQPEAAKFLHDIVKKKAFCKQNFIDITNVQALQLDDVIQGLIEAEAANFDIKENHSVSLLVENIVAFKENSSLKGKILSLCKETETNCRGIEQKLGRLTDRTKLE